MVDYHDRQKVTADEKDIVLRLSDYNFEPPVSDIHSGAQYYYSCNKEWAKIIDGHVSWLASVAAWKEAENQDYHGITQILKFLRRVTLPTPPEFDCGDVEDCLETSDIIAEIHTDIDGISSGGGGNGNPDNVDKPANEGSNYEQGNEDAFTPVDCGDDDKDKLWGAIDTMVSYMHDTNIDFFQQIAVYTSRAQLLSTVISGIPLVGLLPIDEAISGAAQLSDILGVEYLGAVTTSGLYEIKCDLFCQAVDNGCQFDINTAFNYFLDNMGVATLDDASSFESWFEHIASGLTITGNEVFNFMSAFQLAIADLGEKFGGASGMKSYVKASQAGALNPNSEWRAWCDECPPEDGDWELWLDFANDLVVPEGAVVYRNAFNLLRPSTAFSNTNAATLTEQYGYGAKYNAASSTQFHNKQLNIANAGALFKQLQIMAAKSGGSGTNMSIDTDSNTYNPSPRSFTSSTPTLSSAVGVGNVAGTPASVTRIALNFSQVSGTSQGHMKYIKLTGTGELPRFV
jgi:hypothetical protein